MQTQVNLYPIAIILLLINLLAVFMMWNDKRKAKQENVRRTPEKTLMTMALFMGAPGILLGMQWFRHKTQKPKFKFGVPFMLILQIGLIYFLNQELDIQYFWEKPF